MAFFRSHIDFVIALDSCTPSNVLSDEVLLGSVHRFFRKGTADECFRLLPEEFRSDKRFERINSLRTPVPVTPQPHQPRDTATSAEEYFRAFIPDKAHRFERLVKVAHRITEFQIQESVDPGRVYNEDSIVDTPITQTGAIVGSGSICGEESILRTSIARAEAIFEKISSKQDTKAYRYNLLYFSNAVDQYESLQLVVSPGRRNKSIAFDTISRGDQKKREIARRTYSDACRYLECSEIGGPGSLLSMNAAKSDMENLNNEDIRLLCNYRKIHTSVEKQSRSLDFIVVKELVKGLLAQGIERVDIMKGLTRLTKLICRHVDTKSFAEDGKIFPRLVTADSNGYCNRASQSPVGPGPGTDVRLPTHTISLEQQGPVLISHALQSQQTHRAAEPYTNIAKRRRISGNQHLQPPPVCPILIPGNNASTIQAEGQCFLSHISILQEQKHDTTPIGRRNISATSHMALDNMLIRREASDTTDSSNEGMLDTNATTDHDNLPDTSTINIVDSIRNRITDSFTIENSVGNSIQLINQHSPSESSLVDRTCASCLPSTTPTHTSTPNHIELDSGRGDVPTRLSDYIDPETVEDIREWETVWAPGET